jgi:hypothetical protein
MLVASSSKWLRITAIIQDDNFTAIIQDDKAD